MTSPKEQGTMFFSDNYYKLPTNELISKTLDIVEKAERKETAQKMKDIIEEHKTCKSKKYHIINGKKWNCLDMISYIIDKKFLSGEEQR